ncbi:MAG TPA: ribulose bisphosphate carboxylase small subunit [Leptolyngbyaceae cyanobacterium M65_K2018_010]|nr:ribulose bisphosphate carboxylase small subunit [Leptolyngbyaceae cyanobacterium M65_K2018_010]
MGPGVRAKDPPLSQVHSLAQVTGDVRFRGEVAIALGAVVRAELEANCSIGAGSVLQEGAAIYALPPGKVLGDDQAPYTVWLGEQVTLTHKVLIQGPVYLGSGSFVGFRSTLMNARLGQGCIVLMHALVQDVEVPAGKLVPSGAVITRQEQADALPDVSAANLALVREILGHGNFPASLSAQPAAAASSPPSNEPNGLGTMHSQTLTSDIVQRVRQYLSQGLRIGTEHADTRRYRSGVWQTCSPIQATRETEALQALEVCLAEHAGEYVRMFGIDPRAKQRVAPVTIQRPDGRPVELNGGSSLPPLPSSQAYRPIPSQPGSGGSLSPEVIQQVRHYLNQGYRIGTEHADARRYRSGVWQTCSPIASTRESEVLAALASCLADHAGEYVRLFGIDPRANQRIAPITIQRPDGGPLAVSPSLAPASSGPSHNGGSWRSSASVPMPGGDLAHQVRQLIQQGYHIGAEHADSRRYRSGVWQTCPPITSNRETEVLAAISACMAQHPGEYVRIFGIDPVAKRRGEAITIQRPGQSSTAAASHAPEPAPTATPGVTPPTPVSPGASGQPLSQDLVQQVHQLVNQGYRLSLEHADQRRYRSGAWQTSAALEGSRPSDILAALAAQLRQHQGEYVRLIGIDPKMKRRVLETTIQRP